MQSIGDSYQKTKSQIEIAAKKAAKKPCATREMDPEAPRPLDRDSG